MTVSWYLTIGQREKMPGTPNFRLDEETHTYYQGDRKIPGVTTIVNSVYGEPSYATEWHMRRGSMIHKAIALILAGQLDMRTLDERIFGRIEAAEKAISELGLSGWSLLETPMYHPRLLYAGTPDLVVGNRLIDWKSSEMATSEPQMGGYAELLAVNPPIVTVKTCTEITLADDGKYAITDYKADRCRGLFMAAYTVYNWKRGKNGTAD